MSKLQKKQFKKAATRCIVPNAVLFYDLCCSQLRERDREKLIKSAKMKEKRRRVEEEEELKKTKRLLWEE